VIIAILEILPIFEVDIKPLLASAGIAGLAIGFGAQTLVKDVINGFFILVENQYNVGDVVRIAGVKGSVEAMTMRRTVLRDADGALHIVPNSEVSRFFQQGTMCSAPSASRNKIGRAHV